MRYFRITLLAASLQFCYLKQTLQAMPQPVPSCVKERDFGDGPITTPMVYGLNQIEIDCLTKAAEAGNNDAATRLSEFYLMGWKTDIEKYLKWLKVAADNHDISSQIELGRWLMRSNASGIKNKTDIEAGILWLKQAAGAGDHRAMYSLAEHYKRESITAAEASLWQAKALAAEKSWRLKAADAGDEFAAEQLLKESLDQKESTSDVLVRMEKYIPAKIKGILSFRDHHLADCSRCGTGKDLECEINELSSMRDLGQYEKLLVAVQLLRKNGHDVQAMTSIEILAKDGNRDAVKLRDFLLKN